MQEWGAAVFEVIISVAVVKENNYRTVRCAFTADCSVQLMALKCARGYIHISHV